MPINIQKQIDYREKGDQEDWGSAKNRKHMTDWISHLQAEFLQNPQACVDRLVADCELKGDRRRALVQCFLANQQNPAVARFFWLMLLPYRLSLVSVAGRCNLACRMCGGSKGVFRYLNSEDFTRMIHHAPSVEMVTFVAGNSEPLMNPDLADNIGICRDAKINWDIVTNGHMLNKSLLEVMVSNSVVSRINVSIDACRETTYRAIRGVSISGLLDNLRALRDAKRSRSARYPILSLLMVGMEDNIAELPEMIELAAELQADRVHVDHMLGNYTPGDFTRNPAWREAVKSGWKAGLETGVKLELPHDVYPPLDEKIEFGADVKTPATGEQSRRSDTGESPDKTDNSVQCLPSRKSNVEYCPWLDQVHVQLDGIMNPCCNVQTAIGNILDGPLWENTVYLRARMAHMRGKLYRACMSNRNCAYVGNLTSRKIHPEFMD